MPGNADALRVDHASECPRSPVTRQLVDHEGQVRGPALHDRRLLDIGADPVAGHAGRDPPAGELRADGLVGVVHGGDDVAAGGQFPGECGERGARHGEAGGQEDQGEAARRGGCVDPRVRTRSRDRRGRYDPGEPFRLQEPLRLALGHVRRRSPARRTCRVGHGHHQLPAARRRHPGIGAVPVDEVQGAAAHGAVTGGGGQRQYGGGCRRRGGRSEEGDGQTSREQRGQDGPA